ncbi:MAG: shikimate kinase [Bacillota bacterium]|nr:shikimate kinase [Bacillota bacterium]
MPCHPLTDIPWNPARPRIALIGFMATGKSSVGQSLAASLGIPFRDLDREIVTAAGMSIPEIFSRQGEAGFRALETRLLQKLACGSDPLLLATGGGVPLRPENRCLLRQGFVVIELTAEPETVQRRVGEAQDRPLLTGRNNSAAIRRLMEERRPAYEEVRHLQVAVDGLRIDEICLRLRSRLAALPPASSLVKPESGD